MKRVLGLLFILLICAAGYLSIWGYLPFIPVIGSGMEPGIRSGSLLVTEPLVASDIKEGNIIIFNVPPLVRERYNYPPLVAHRVVEVINGPSGLQLQTKGDNADADPFLVKASDIKGAIKYQIPYLGLPLVFLQSQPGTIFIAIAIVLLAIFLYSNDIIVGLWRRRGEFISPVVQENQRVSLVLSNRFERTEKALESFASAMQQYAQHMASHTSAIQGLSEASQALKNSAVEQNQILYRLSHTLGTEKSVEVTRFERVISELEKRTMLVLQVKDELEGKNPAAEINSRVKRPAIEINSPGKRPATESTSPGEIPPELRVHPTPGCLVNPRALRTRGHFFAKSAV
jgi:signal peptidase I